MFDTVKKMSRPVLRALVVSCAVTPIAWAQTLPASVAACASETDSLRRLVCYDREIARYNTSGPAPSAGSAAPRGTVPTTPPAANAAKAAPPPTSVTTPTAPAATMAPESAAAPPPVAGAPAPTAEPRHITGHVASVDNGAERIVVHLDNGQIWEQIQDSSAQPGLRSGDAVTIDRSMGAYWLSGRDGASVKVRLRK